MTKNLKPIKSSLINNGSTLVQTLIVEGSDDHHGPYVLFFFIYNVFIIRQFIKIVVFYQHTTFKEIAIWRIMNGRRAYIAYRIRFCILFAILWAEIDNFLHVKAQLLLLELLSIWIFKWTFFHTQKIHHLNPTKKTTLWPPKKK